jgi:hypothetical protein
MKTIFIALAVALVAFAAGVWYTREYAPTPVPESPIVENPTTTPETPKPTYMNASADKIVVDSPKPGEAVGTTFSVMGKARGNWYFEASFPLQVLSSQGSLLKEMPVQADGEWMTTEFVPFSETVTLPPGTKGAATLILKNDNPSGLPENDASISIPIYIQ